MADIFAGIVGLLGLGGAVMIVASKIPLLADLADERRLSGETVRSFLSHAIAGTKTGKMLSSPEYLLQKALSTVRVVALRVEHATSKRLEDIRRQTKEAREKFSQPYWDRVKRTKSKRQGA